MAVESLKVLRRRVRSVRSIKQITRAMEMVAAAKLRRSQVALRAGKPFADKLQELLANLAEGSETLSEHPLFAAREGSRKVLVLFTADRGLCGSFNTNLIKAAEDLLKSQPDTQWELICVGRKGRDYFQRRQWPIVDSVTTLKGRADVDEARRLGDLLVERFENDECDSVSLLYASFVSTILSRPTVVPYLPMSAEALTVGGETEADRGETSGRTEYLFDPSAEAVVDAILPRYLTSKLYITMAENATAEHSARMVAMNNATKNCEELGDALTLKLNKARQASITKELLDIVGGAEALQG